MNNKKEKIDLETKTNTGLIIGVGLSILAIIAGAFMAVIGVMAG